MLRYPYDRFHGYVQLSDKDGQPYVPERRECNTTAYCRAFIVLAGRVHRAMNYHPFGGESR